MKSSVSHVLSFITTLLFTLLIAFIFIEFNLRHSILINKLNSINYYNSAYNTIVSKVDNFIVNEEIKEKYKDFITKDIIKKDVNSIISKTDYNISHYDDFYKIINEYSSDVDICEKYSKEIDSIYTNNIFPINEYKLINKFYAKIYL